MNVSALDAATRRTHRQMRANAASVIRAFHEQCPGDFTPDNLAESIVDALSHDVDPLITTRALAMELYVPVPSPTVGYVVLRRDVFGEDRWAVTEHALNRLRAWVGGDWRDVSDVGRAAAFRWTLTQALEIAAEAAAHEADQWRTQAFGESDPLAAAGLTIGADQ